VQFQASASGEQVQNVLRLREFWIKPGIFQLSRRDDRHAVVEPDHEVIGLCRDDREGVEFLTCWSDPPIVEAGKRDILLIFWRGTTGLPGRNGIILGASPPRVARWVRR